MQIFTRFRRGITVASLEFNCVHANMFDSTTIKWGTHFTSIRGRVMNQTLQYLSKMGALIVIAAFLSGCASIASGTTQTLQISSNPDKATCNLERGSKVIGSVASTPCGVVVEKTKHDNTAKCEKAGYQMSTGYLHSGVEGSTWGNIILGGGIGWAIDSARGADNHYPENITLTLVPAEGSVLAAKCIQVQLEAIYMAEVDKTAPCKQRSNWGVMKLYTADIPTTLK